MPNSDASARSGPPLLVSLFGRPGAGKTSVGDALADRHGFVHLPLGRLLKQPGTLAEIGIDPVAMGRAVASGRTITDERLYPWLDAQILSQTAPVVVDGYPRVPGAVGPFNGLAVRLAPTCAVIALHIDCPADQAADRIARRGRPDDKMTSLHDRNDEYLRVQLPLLSLLAPSVRRIRVDASGSLPATIDLTTAELGLGPPRRDNAVPGLRGSR